MAFTRNPAALHATLADVTGADHHQDLPALSTGGNQMLVSDGVGVFRNEGPVSTASMQAGLSTTYGTMHPLNIAQAIAAQSPPTQMIRSGNVTANAVSVTWGTAFASAPSVVPGYFTTSTASRHSHAKTSSTTGATLFGNENAEPLDVFAKLATP